MAERFCSCRTSSHGQQIAGTTADRADLLSRFSTPRWTRHVAGSSCRQEEIATGRTDSGVAFHPEEARYLQSLEQKLRRVEEWPLDSPLAFVIHLASRTKGRLGELFLDEIATGLAIETQPSGSPDFDRTIVRPDGRRIRVETKFSTEDPPRFQQVRDPRLGEGRLKYDQLVCLSGRPEGMVYWVFSAEELGVLMDEEALRIGPTP